MPIGLVYSVHNLFFLYYYYQNVIIHQPCLQILIVLIYSIGEAFN
jgi:hypothetical protein